MKKFCLLFFIVVNYSFSQNQPYLNASTGNSGQSFTDADTNLYMYHSNRLEKVNKNLVPIWVNTYTNLSFNNVLLSKTGSMYFIASGDKVGKLHKNGNIDWVKAINNSTITINSINYTLSVNCNRLLLDRNDNLILTGTATYSTNSQCGMFMKLDTLGNIIKTRIFKNINSPCLSTTFDNLYAINDSLGNYRLCATGTQFGGLAGAFLNYSDVADSISKGSCFGLANYGSSAHFYQSKFASDFYIGVSAIDNSSYSFTRLLKFVNFGNTWTYDWSTWNLNSYFSGITEDEKGNLLLSSVAWPYQGFHMGFIGLDSNGLYNGINTKVISNYPFSTNPVPPLPASQLHSIHSGNYFFDVTGANFPSNPLTIGYSSLVCTGTMSLGVLSNTVSVGSSFGVPKTYNVTSLILPPFSSSATPVTNFSVASNFCQIMNVMEQEVTGGLSVFPNPVKDKLIVKQEGLEIKEIKIFDLSGREILRSKNTEIEVSDVQPGTYIVRIYADGHVVNKKFVKE